MVTWSDINFDGSSCMTILIIPSVIRESSPFLCRSHVHASPRTIQKRVIQLYHIFVIPSCLCSKISKKKFNWSKRNKSHVHYKSIGVHLRKKTLVALLKCKVSNNEIMVLIFISVKDKTCRDIRWAFKCRKASSYH